MCDEGYSENEQNCQKNFQGSAKSMGLATVACRNRFSKGFNMELGILISDDDSGTIVVLRENGSHEIVKLADKNTRKGVVGQSYELKQKNN